MTQIKKCNGCGWLSINPLGQNMYGNPYSACCPDSDYNPITSVKFLECMLSILKLKLKSNEISIDSYIIKVAEFIEQALAMEKEQIINAWNNCKHNKWGNENTITNAEEYYNEQYEK